jgi:hypothetical protein
VSNSVNHPSHYRSETGHEAIDVIEAWGLGFNTGNALKYISRCGLKTCDPILDLEKARWYLEREIEKLKKQKGSVNNHDLLNDFTAEVETKAHPQKKFNFRKPEKG